MRLSSIGLQRRITLYVAVGLAILVTVFSLVALQAADRSSDAILEERRLLARTLAVNVDRTVNAITVAINGIADSPHIGTDGANPESTFEAVLDVASESLADINFGAEPNLLAILRPDGATVVATGFSSEDQALIDELGRMVPADSPAPVTGSSGSIFIGMSATLEGASSYRLVSAFSPSPELLRIPSGAEHDPASYRAELIEPSGNVVQTSNGTGSTGITEHLEVLDELAMASGRETSTHSPSNGDDRGVKHVVAYASLSSLPWAVLLEQPEDITLAIPNALRDRILIVSGGAFVIALALAWLTTRQVVRPLSLLETQAGRIAAGDLGGRVEPTGQDEIRRLAESFEIMRGRLERSQGDLAELNQQLEQRVQERTVQLEQRSRERDALLRRVISAQEDERKRVARDLHDQVGQSLTGLTMNLASAEAELGKRDPESAERLSELRAATSEVISEVRRLMSDLRPSILDDMGLASAVGWYLETHVERVGIETGFEARGLDRPIPSNVEISAFRVVQEACNNIVKHANAMHVNVRLELVDDQLSGTITDDGDGFDISGVELGASGGWAVGLMGMRERVALLGGDLRIDSGIGNGTSVHFLVPIQGDLS